MPVARARWRRGSISARQGSPTPATPSGPRVLAEVAHAADLLAVEAHTFDRLIRYHLDYQTLRAHLAEIQPERVVLTHMSADMLSRLADSELPTAYDGMLIDI